MFYRSEHGCGLEDSSGKHKIVRDDEFSKFLHLLNYINTYPLVHPSISQIS